MWPFPATLGGMRNLNTGKEPGPPEGPARNAMRRVDSPDMIPRLHMLIESCGGDPGSAEGRWATEWVLTALKSLTDQTGPGERRLMTRAVKEMRHAFRVFAAYPSTRKISVFGSARTPPEHPDYLAAVEMSRLLAEDGWLVITGAGDGIMKAGHEGPGPTSSFGLAIRLPFETTANTIISGDAKLLHFNYFFTRKLMFASQCDAVAAFPGGFGTQDELLEVLTLMQTGKSGIVPVVLLEGSGGSYWAQWDAWVTRGLGQRGFIDGADSGFYHVAADPADAVAHIRRFYANYRSSRYVHQQFVIRMQHRLAQEDVAALNDEFGFLVARGTLRQSDALPQEDDSRELPRLVFHHNRRHYAGVRALIDRINDLHLSRTAATEQPSQRVAQ